MLDFVLNLPQHCSKPFWLKSFGILGVCGRASQGISTLGDLKCPLALSITVSEGFAGAFWVCRSYIKSKVAVHNEISLRPHANFYYPKPVYEYCSHKAAVLWLVLTVTKPSK